MPDHGAADQDPFQTWLESSRTFFASDQVDPQMNDSLKERCEGLFAAWTRFAQAYAEASGGATSGAKDGPFDPVGWLEAAGEGGFGDLWRWFGGNDGFDPWREERDLLLTSRQWQRYIAALERYRAIMSAAWLKAFQRFVQDLAKDRPREGLPDWNAIRSHWQNAAEAELAVAQASEEFLDAQRNLIHARLACSALLQERIERIARMLGLPTRAEVDSLHETVHRLRREIRTLRARLDRTE